VNTVMNFRISQKTGTFSSSWAIAGFSIIRPNILHGVYLWLSLFSHAYQSSNIGNWQWRYSCHFLTMNTDKKQISCTAFWGFPLLFPKYVMVYW
jgi:hypothetical protein